MSDQSYLEDQMRIATRLLYVINHAPYSMGTCVRFINGTHRGLLSWSDGVNKHAKSWIPQTMQEIVSLFTADVMRVTYGSACVEQNELERKDAIVLRLHWIGDESHKYYMGFSNERTMKSWLKTHLDWLVYERVR